jgi:hypothetical protein
MKEVYFSYSYKTTEEDAEAIKSKLLGLGLEVLTYQRGTEYSDIPIKNCEAFILLLPDDARRIAISNLTKGIQQELYLAHNLKKDIFLVDKYTTLYESYIDTRNGTIERMSGTNFGVIEKLQQEPKPKKSQELDWLKTPETDIIL